MNSNLEKQLALAISRDERGIAMEALCQSIGEAASRRTIQRQLDELIKLRWVERTGLARGTRYRLTENGRRVLLAKPEPELSARVMEDEVEYGAPAKPARPVKAPTESEPAEQNPAANLVPVPVISSEARPLRDIIRQDKAFRKPTGYRRGFLDDYQPNATFYLPETLREKLRNLGQSDDMAALPPGTYARHVLDRMLIDLSWNSSRLEGSTYSLLETDHLLARGHTDNPTRALEAQMVLNHKAAIEFLVESPGELGYNRFTFMNLHAFVSDGLLEKPEYEGGLRQQPVSISGSVFHPVNNPAVIDECFDLILKKAGSIVDPLERSFFLMVHLPYLQPFHDANKRTSRLAANLPLIQQNLAPLTFVDVPQRDYTDGILAVYELNRVEILRDVFAWAYERSAPRYAAIRREIGEPEPLRVRYREEIKDRVRDVVVRGLNKPAAAEELRRWAAANITATDRAFFIQMVEVQLLALTEGNMMRMRIRPSEFTAWWPVWTSLR